MTSPCLERNKTWYVTASDQVTYTRLWIRIYYNRSMERHWANLMFCLCLNHYCFINHIHMGWDAQWSLFHIPQPSIQVCSEINLHAFFFYDFRHLRQMSKLYGSIHQYLWIVEIGFVRNHVFLEFESGRYIPFKMHCNLACIYLFCPPGYF